jgi:hypothetical protein
MDFTRYNTEALDAAGFYEKKIAYATHVFEKSTQPNKDAIFEEAKEKALFEYKGTLSMDSWHTACWPLGDMPADSPVLVRANAISGKKLPLYPCPRHVFGVGFVDIYGNLCEPSSKIVYFK